jgi:hypothetical protein
LQCIAPFFRYVALRELVGVIVGHPLRLSILSMLLEGVTDLQARDDRGQLIHLDLMLDVKQVNSHLVAAAV